MVAQLLEEPSSKEGNTPALAKPLSKEIGCDPVSSLTTSLAIQTESRRVTTRYTQPEKSIEVAPKGIQSGAVMCTNCVQTAPNMTEKGIFRYNLQLSNQ